MSNHQHQDYIEHNQMKYLSAIAIKEASNGRKNNDEGIDGDRPQQMRLVTCKPKYPVMHSDSPVTEFLYELFDTKKSIGQ